MKYTRGEEKIAKQIIEFSLVNGRINEGKIKSFVFSAKKLKISKALPLIGALVREIIRFNKKQTLLVESAQNLENKYLQRVKKTFEKKEGRNLNLEFKKNTSLLSGIKISLGDTVWDYSVNSMLENFTETVRG